MELWCTTLWVHSGWYLIRLMALWFLLATMGSLVLFGYTTQVTQLLEKVSTLLLIQAFLWLLETFLTQSTTMTQWQLSLQICQLYFQPQYLFQLWQVHPRLLLPQIKSMKIKLISKLAAVIVVKLAQMQ